MLAVCCNVHIQVICKEDLDTFIVLCQEPLKEQSITANLAGAGHVGHVKKVDAAT